MIVAIGAAVYLERVLQGQPETMTTSLNTQIYEPGASGESGQWTVDGLTRTTIALEERPDSAQYWVKVNATATGRSPVDLTEFGFQIGSTRLTVSPRCLDEGAYEECAIPIVVGVNETIEFLMPLSDTQAALVACRTLGGDGTVRPYLVSMSLKYNLGDAATLSEPKPRALYCSSLQ